MPTAQMPGREAILEMQARRARLFPDPPTPEEIEQARETFIANLESTSADWPRGVR